MIAVDLLDLYTVKERPPNTLTAEPSSCSSPQQHLASTGLPPSSDALVHTNNNMKNRNCCCLESALAAADISKLPVSAVAVAPPPLSIFPALPFAALENLFTSPRFRNFLYKKREHSIASSAILPIFNNPDVPFPAACPRNTDPSRATTPSALQHYSYRSTSIARHTTFYRTTSRARRHKWREATYP